MQRAAAPTGADVVLARFSLDPRARMPVLFSVLIHMGDRPHLLDDMMLYIDRSNQPWLLPSIKGPFVALLRDGLREDVEPPFLTFRERCQGIDAACTVIAGHTRFLEAA